MKYSNEIKVGSAIVITLIILFFGIRYLDDIPLFSTTYNLYAEFDDARGIVTGNSVQISGVKVGSVQEVAFNPENNKVHVQLRIDSQVKLSEGSEVEITGFEALNVVQMTIYPGPPSDNIIAPNSTIPTRAGEDVFDELTDKAPELVDQIDTVLAGLDGVIGDARYMLQPEGDLQILVHSLSNSARSIESLVRAERSRISSILASFDTVATNLGKFSGPGADSITATVSSLNELLARLDTSLVQFEQTTVALNEIARKINEGEGTVGMMINDPALYHKLDSTVTNMNALVTDIRENPIRYMRATTPRRYILTTSVSSSLFVRTPLYCLPMPTYDDALTLFHEWTKGESLRRHAYAVEAAMHHYAKLQGANEELYRMTGLLHDMDYERHNNMEEHPYVGVKVLQEAGYPEEMTEAIMGHAIHTGVPRTTQMAKTLFAVDELAGFITAVAYVRPTKLEGMKPKSVKKKLKDKQFAAAVSREDIALGVEELDTDLDTHIANVIAGMQAQSERLGL